MSCRPVPSQAPFQVSLFSLSPLYVAAAVYYSPTVKSEIDLINCQIFLHEDIIKLYRTKLLAFLLHMSGFSVITACSGP